MYGNNKWVTDTCIWITTHGVENTGYALQHGYWRRRRRPVWRWCAMEHVPISTITLSWPTDAECVRLDVQESDWLVSSDSQNVEASASTRRVQPGKGGGNDSRSQSLFDTSLALEVCILVVQQVAVDGQHRYWWCCLAWQVSLLVRRKARGVVVSWIDIFVEIYEYSPQHYVLLLTFLLRWLVLSDPAHFLREVECIILYLDRVVSWLRKFSKIPPLARNCVLPGGDEPSPP